MLPQPDAIEEVLDDIQRRALRLRHRAVEIENLLRFAKARWQFVFRRILIRGVPGQRPA
jgi:hypothetical protein